MADIKQAADITSTALTWTLSSLASDGNLVIGRSSAAVDNTTNLYLDYLVSGVWMQGTTPTTAKILEIWLWGTLNTSSDYPGTITGSDANVTFTTRDVLSGACSLIWSCTPDTTTGRVWTMRPTGIAQFFGGILPSKWGLWMVHNSVAALNSTAGNHVFKYTPRYRTLS